MSSFQLMAAERLANVTGLPLSEISIAPPPKPEMGDFGFPCFALAKTKKKAPPLIANELAAQLTPPPGDVFSEVRAVGPYVNFVVSMEALAGETAGKALANPQQWGKSASGAGKTVIVEYSSPNIAKPLGVHHIRSTMIGSALARMYAAAGWNVVPMNFLGDWGTTFGQLMVAFKEKEKEEAGKPVDIFTLLHLYIQFHSEADEEAEEAARAWFRKLEEGDDEARRLWTLFRNVSIQHLKELYDRLNVDFPDEAFKGEAFCNDKMGATMARLAEKGILKESNGALVVDLDAYDMPPCLIRKRDGATIYATRDLAIAEWRYDQFKFDKALYVVANQQELHFRQVFKTLELMGHSWAKNCEHIKFGMLSFGPGVFGDLAATGSTRKGNVVFLTDVLNETVLKAYHLIEDNARDPEVTANAKKLAEQVGVGAVIFSEFLQRRNKDVTFTWEKALNLHGDSGPYLQYTHARLSSVIRKYGDSLPAKVDWKRLESRLERDVLLKLGEYQQVLDLALAENEPSMIASYLLELAAVFNRMFTDRENHRLITADESLTAARVSLVEVVRLTLAKGLEILGLAAPEKM